MATKYTRRKDGRWGTNVWDGTYKESGKRNYIPVYSDKSSLDLERKVNAIKNELQNGTYVLRCNTSIGNYAKNWLAVYKAPRGTNTRAMYQNIIDKHLTDIEDLQFKDLTHSKIQLVINNCLDKPRICQQVKLTIRQIIRAAIMDRLLPANAQDTLTNNLELPKYKAKEKRPLYPEEIKTIKKADFTDRERAFVYILYACGLRRGEALALTIFDLDFKKAELSVNKAIAFDLNKKEDKDTKNFVHRIVPMPPFLVDNLEDYVKNLHGNTLFTKLDSTPITKSSYVKMWDSIVKKMNIAAGGTDTLKVIHGLTAHIFRHNYCTMLCYVYSIKKVAKLMGDTEEVVMKTYSHILEEKEDKENKINDIIAL